MHNHNKGTRRIVFWVILVAGIIVTLAIFSKISGLVMEWLWMSQLGYGGVFWRLLTTKWGLFAVAFTVVFLFFWINLGLILRNLLRVTREHDFDMPIVTEGQITSTRARVVPPLLSAFIALVFGLILSTQWDTYLRFRWAGSFGQYDPIFGVDIGFYLFHLPFYELIQISLIGLTLLAFLLVLLAYLYLEVLQFRQEQSRRRNWTVIGHVSILFLFFVGAWAWGYYLDRFELLYSTRGVVYGAGYTANNVTRITLWIMVFAAVALGALILVNLFRHRFKIILVGIGSYFVLYFSILVVLPGMVQKFWVEPNELELEAPYLKHNIDFTRKAYQLDKIEERAYPALTDLSFEQISQNQDTIRNIRLWDWRPILETYRQTQEIRLYYQFYDVDVGRYHLKDGYHQLMLSARELSPKLPQKARTWVNQRLQFTHGSGLVMSFVSKKTEEGLPHYLVENIPPVSNYSLNVNRPGIYYGEKMPGYRIVTTKVKEFDYPKGNQNVYAGYEGKGGVPLDSYWKRILFAWTLSDVNILLTSYLGPESRIQIWRRVQERVAKIAPFLHLDKDPYMVLSNGKLYWIQDAYTVSNRFPYSQPYVESFGKSLNYIRNSVKVVADAYEGSVRFYVMDPQDPVLRVYREAFPKVFKELGELSKDLKTHLRYPGDLFAIQADIYRTYHMTNPQVFYNREDFWTFPQEKYAGTAIHMIPYYILMRLPGEKDLMYLLMTPFTPQNKNNMIAWMAAKCDFPEYGKVLVYQLPKERLTFGPIQVEAMIDQNTLISEQLSLWDQRGSRVIRGNLIVIPMDNSFLYVEPVYLTAEGTNIPQLKRVIVVSGDKVVMEPTLDGGLKALFGAGKPEKKEVTAPAPGQIEELNRARKGFEMAEEAMKRGRWEDFGRAMESLKQFLLK